MSSLASEWLHWLGEMNGAPGSQIPRGGVLQRMPQGNKIVVDGSDTLKKKKLAKHATKAEELLQAAEGLGAALQRVGDRESERRGMARQIKKVARGQHRQYKKAVKRQVRQHLRQRGRETRYQARSDAAMAKRGLM